MQPSGHQTPFRIKLPGGRRGLLATLAIAAAILAQRGGPFSLPTGIIWVALVVALVCATVALPDPPIQPGTGISAVPDRARLTFYAAVLLIVPAIGAAFIWSGEPFSRYHTYVHDSATWAALLWLAGLLAALMFLGRQHGVGDAVRTGIRAVGARELLALGLILAIAAGLRVWNAGSVPEGIWSDEADSAADAVRLLHLPFQPFPPGNFGHNPCLYFYVLALCIKLAGNTIAVMRFCSAAFGVLGVLAVYLAARQIGGARLGLVSACLMATAQWGITFSRVGMPDIPVPAITGLGYAAFAAAMRRPRPLWFALSGVLLGFSFITYPGAYLPAAVAMAILWTRTARDRRYAREGWPARLLFPIGIVAAAMPTLVALGQDGNFVLARVHTLSLYNEYHTMPDRLHALLSNIHSYTLMFTVAGDNNGRHNLSGAPMLDAVTGTLLLLGVGMSLRRIGSWPSQVLLLWFGSNVLSGILSVDYEAPHGARTLGALAPIAIIAALPLVALATAAQQLAVQRLATQATERRQTAARRFWGALPIACLLVPLLLSGVLSWNRYFNQQATSLVSWTAMSGPLAITGRAIPPLQARGYTVLVDPTVVDELVLHYVAPNWQPAAYNARDPLALPRNRRLALIVPADQRSLREAILAAFPDTAVSTLAPSFDRGDVQAYVLHLPASR